ncbi:MAG: chorismate mutase [Spirochaetes bacterium]|nr:chorismate mutase [Spirochaetota bacterium]
MRKELQLENIRSKLIRLEETIIFSLIERAQFSLNKAVYNKNQLAIPDFDDCFFEYLLLKTEQLHATVRRYQVYDEVPFYQNLPESIIKNHDYQWPILENQVNINDSIKKIYLNEILPLICQDDDDGNYGSSAVNDVNVLQAMSHRIHYGKLVAESKYQLQSEEIKKAVIENNKELIWKIITNVDVESRLLKRVGIKAGLYGQDPLSEKKEYKILPETITLIYEKWIIPLTKEVEVSYLIERCRI